MDYWPGGLYSNGMHDFVLRELEIGRRAAAYEESEAVGWGALMDLDYAEYCAAEVAWKADAL